jgi:uncharacterized protein (TIGR03000 family)
MSRLVLAAVVAAALPSLASAQTGIGSRGGFRPTPVTTPSYASPISPVMTSPFVYGPGNFFTGYAAGGAYYTPYYGYVSPYGVVDNSFYSGAPAFTNSFIGGAGFSNVFRSGGFYNPYLGGGYWSFPPTFYSPTGGGFLTAGGLYVPYNTVAPPPVDVVPAVPTVVPVADPTGDAAATLANEFPASLTLEFPGPAKVWLDGKEVEGDAAPTRELTSPVLRPGQRHTFKVKAQWTAGGKTYEAHREITLSAGDRSKLIILSGTPVGESPGK